MSEAAIYKAMGDPVRLEMIQRLATQTHHTIGSLSKNLGITRQAARKQIQVLVTAELVQLEPRGREIQTRLNTAQLHRARQFITHLEQQWDQRLAALKQMVGEQQ